MSRHKCTEAIYKAFLQASCVRYSGLALSEVCPEQLSHDSLSRWLQSQHFRPRELWSLVEKNIDIKEPCLLIADDSVLSKTRSKKVDLVHYQYSGNAHDVIAGIGLVNLLWHSLDTKESIPVDYRIYDKPTDGKTKNTHFCEMLKLAKQRGIVPDAVVVDAWYSSLKNLKAIRSLEWTWVCGLRKNRIVNRNQNLEELDIPDEGLKVHLRGYGWIWVYRFVAKNGRIDYIGTNLENPTRDAVKAIVDARWSIEVYHRELKQTCGIERCQARTGRAQRNHIFLAIAVWFRKHRLRCRELVTLYKQQWNIVSGAISNEMQRILAMN